MRLPINMNPARSVIVSDPSKLTYFARANAVRAGTAGTWGSFAGLGQLGLDTSDQYNFVPGSGVDGNAIVTGQNPEATAGTTKAAGAFQTVGDLFGNIGRTLLGANSPTPVVVAQPAPSPMPYIIAGVAAAGAIGFIAYKMMK